MITSTATQPVTTATSTINSTHPKFDKFVGVLAALEPLIIAGISPFIKDQATGSIVAVEAPLAQVLLTALSEL